MRYLSLLLEQARSRSEVSAKKIDDRGFALIAVVVASALIAILALTLMNYSRSVSNTSALFVADIETQTWAEAGLNRLLLAFSKADDPLRKLLQSDGRRVPWDFHGHSIELRVQAESGKLDLNAGDQTHITNLLVRLVEPDHLRFGILEHIASARSNGVKLQSVAEILPPFERMTSLRDTLESYFTVYTNQIGIDVATAPSLIVETIPGLPQQLAADILRGRDTGERISLANLPSDIARRFVQQRPIYTFHSEVRSGFKKAGAMRAVVQYGEHNKVMIFAWEVAGARNARAEPSGISSPF